ncbi:hypothetical protein FHQ08_09660 [Lactobacillus sp. CC-MHH1034]|uniref:hypothetical protein n=1 Tax=Agrilactobacillus fermenti TaxID=2586909 RepID=UPI001E28799F|nr:hypothetical protein [Agrilactobacillus fermenti]MCD2256988.1 hypothetical protein [Agrilactobacillus fermenti]
MSRSFIVKLAIGMLLSFAIMWYLLTKHDSSYSLVVIGGIVAAISVGAAIAEIITGTFQTKKRD